MGRLPLTNRSGPKFTDGSRLPVSGPRGLALAAPSCSTSLYVGGRGAIWRSDDEGWSSKAVPVPNRRAGAVSDGAGTQ